MRMLFGSTHLLDVELLQYGSEVVAVTVHLVQAFLKRIAQQLSGLNRLLGKPRFCLTSFEQPYSSAKDQHH